MRLRIANQKEFVAGCVFFVIGVSWALKSLEYDFGRLTHMGPGYFPFCAALLLTAVGLLAAVRALGSANNAPIQRFPVLSLVIVLSGVIIFAALIRTAGLIPASLIVTTLACYKRIRTNPFEVVALCIGLTVLVVLIFSFGLGLPMKLY